MYARQLLASLVFTLGLVGCGVGMDAESDVALSDAEFAARARCTDTSRLRSMATLLSAAPSGPRTVDLNVSDFKEGAVFIYMTPADSMELDSFVGKSLAASPQGTIRVSGLTILNPSGDSRLTLYSVGDRVVDGQERFLKPGQSYKILISTFSQLQVNCLVHYDNVIRTVTMPELPALAQQAQPSVTLQRYGYSKYSGNNWGAFNFTVKSPTGISSFRAFVDGVGVDSLKQFGVKSADPALGLSYNVGVYNMSPEAAARPHLIEIEVTTLEGLTQKIQQTVAFKDFAWEQ